MDETTSKTMKFVFFYLFALIVPYLIELTGIAHPQNIVIFDHSILTWIAFSIPFSWLYCLFF